MIHSMEFKRGFWLDDDDKLRSAPWRFGWVDKNDADFVSEWTDFEGVNMDALLNIHRQLIVDSI